MTIHLKNEEDLSRMRTAGLLTRQVLDMIGPHVRPGVLENGSNDFAEISATCPPVVALLVARKRI